MGMNNLKTVRLLEKMKSNTKPDLSWVAVEKSKDEDGYVRIQKNSLGKEVQLMLGIKINITQCRRIKFFFLIQIYNYN